MLPCSPQLVHTWGRHTSAVPFGQSFAPFKLIFVAKHSGARVIIFVLVVWQTSGNSHAPLVVIVPDTHAHLAAELSEWALALPNIIPLLRPMMPFRGSTFDNRFSSGATLRTGHLHAVFIEYDKPICVSCRRRLAEAALLESDDVRESNLFGRRRNCSE